jgi:Zn-dependent protease with chaperone function
MLKARPLNPDTLTGPGQQLLNIVDEMAIASGVPRPAIHILEKETSSVNALVAGHTPEDVVLVITVGAPRHLSRDELQAVIAHEFSHLH